MSNEVKTQENNHSEACINTIIAIIAIFGLIIGYNTWVDSESFGTGISAGVMAAVGCGLYMAPSITAAGRRCEWQVFALNLLLGWTVLGWIIALVWALGKDK